MNPTLYALCQQAVVGPALWITGQCAFPPPLPGTPVALDSSGLVLSQAFKVPVSKGYFLSMAVSFPSVEARLGDPRFGSRPGATCHDESADPQPRVLPSQKQDLGSPLRLRVTVLRIQDDSVAWSADVASSCAEEGHDGKATKFLTLAILQLSEGSYRLQVQNVEARPDLAGLGTSLIIHAVAGK